MRLFLAIHFSGETQRQLLAARDALRAQGQGLFPPDENLHLTLAFIGETDRVEVAKRALQQVEASPFLLRFDRLGQFGDLYWAGACESVALRALQAQLITHLSTAGFLFEKREFIPHVTLARRFVPGADFSAAPLEQILREIEEPIRKITLMVSHLQKSGSRYETLAVKALSEK